MKARELAFLVVRDVFGEPPRSAQGAFDYRMRVATLDTRDRAFAAQLAYGTIKMRRAIDWYLQPYLAARREQLPLSIAEILRLGAYQLRYMDGVDTHAAVFETVSLARKYGHRGTTGLVNAILRRLADDPRLEPSREQFADELEYLAVRHSYPTWMIRTLAARFGAESAERIASEMNRAPQIALRVDLRERSLDEELAELAQLGWSGYASSYASDVLVLERAAHGGVAPASPGRRTVQSEAACMPVDLLDPRPGERVLDLCSGRGNKLVQIALRLRGEGSVSGIDVEQRKVAQAVRALEEARVDNATVTTGDATALDLAPIDAVLVDAPCSGLGVIGRHPEARWRKIPGDGARLAAVQRSLLHSAYRCVRPGGRLVYSVCSVDPRECEEVISGFASDLAAQGAAIADIPPPQRYAEFARENAVVIPPGIDGRDGFYIRALRRPA
jgi:16S rRNA (cytosine967-C5)-methyltransferase